MYFFFINGIQYWRCTSKHAYDKKHHMRRFHYEGIYYNWDISGSWLVDQGQIDRADIMRSGQFTKLRDIPVGIDVGGRGWKQEESRHGGKCTRARGVKGEARWEVRSKNGKQASFVATATWIYGAPLSGLWTPRPLLALCDDVHQAIEVSFRSRISPSFLFLFYGAFPRPRG